MEIFISSGGVAVASVSTVRGAAPAGTPLIGATSSISIVVELVTSEYCSKLD